MPLERLPEFTRVAWASADARAVWEPRVKAVADDLMAMELRSVAAGVRPAALQFTPTTADLRRIDALGLTFVAVTPGRSAVARDRNVAAALAEAYGRDDDAVGALLGFPACCRAFFNEVWTARRLRDTTLAMADRDGLTTPGCNILGRWIGLRHVPHLPCSWHCAEASAFAARLRPHWTPDVLATLDTMLEWPVEYSALHGLAIVTFPVVKILTNTDYTSKKETVRLTGSTYPAEAPRGLVFPFTSRTTTTQPIPVTLVDAREWTDNGFSSRATMDAAHVKLLTVVQEQHPERVLDLGCGNGILLDKIRALGCRVVEGIEMDRERAERGQRKGRPIVVGRIQDLPTMREATFDLAFISENRFTEMTADSLAAVHGWLETHVRTVAIYSYDRETPVRLETMPWKTTTAS